MFTEDSPSTGFCKQAAYSVSFRLAVAVQYSKIDIGYHDFRHNCIIHLLLKNVSMVVFLVAEFG